MKQSKNINLIFINVVAASLLAGCTTPPENKQCVDENGVVIDQSNCNPGSPHYNPHFRWYYGGGLFNRGSRVSGGTYTPTPGRTYASPSFGSGEHASPISRGGFGSSGHVSGGGE